MLTQLAVRADTRPLLVALVKPQSMRVYSYFVGFLRDRRTYCRVIRGVKGGRVAGT